MKEFLPKSAAIRNYTLDEFNLDYICNGRQLLYLYKATGDKKYLRAADVLREYGLTADQIAETIKANI